MIYLYIYLYSVFNKSRAKNCVYEFLSQASYHTNWREREKRGDALYSPVALSPIQNGLMSPDFIMEEDDDLTTKYTKTLNPNR